ERGVATRVEGEVLRHRQHGHGAAQDAPAGTRRQAGAQSPPTGLTRPVLPVTSSRPFAGNQDFGEWLSLVEHLVRDQGVAGSNPVSPTKYPGGITKQIGDGDLVLRVRRSAVNASMPNVDKAVPVFFVQDAKRSIAWYTRVLSFRVLFDYGEYAGI